MNATLFMFAYICMHVPMSALKSKHYDALQGSGNDCGKPLETIVIDFELESYVPMFALNSKGGTNGRCTAML